MLYADVCIVFGNDPLTEYGLKDLISRWQHYWPGLGVAVTIAMAATFLSQRYGAPAMLMSLLLGLAFHFMADNERIIPGIGLGASGVLRLGVALLGLRLTFDDILTLGIVPVIAVCSAVIATLLFGLGFARLLGLSAQLGTLTGGSVGICGASAAMAISSVLPNTDAQRKETLFTVIGVTTLSTLAMVIYPLLSHGLDLSDIQAGLFLGATIHDVAQVVGAGYSVSDGVGDLSTFVKLLRVAMLVPIVIVIGVVVQRRFAASAETAKVPAVPWFLLLFIVLFVLNSLGWVPASAASAASVGAAWMLLVAIAALGVRTSLQEIAGVGLRPIILMVAETAFIAIWMLGFLFYV